MNGRSLWLCVALAACGGEVGEPPLPPMPDFARSNKLAQGQFERAYARVEATAGAPGAFRGSALGDLAMLFHAYERPDEALALYERALALEPNHVDWLYFQAVLLERRGALGGAVAALRRVAALEPDDVNARVRLARCLDRAADGEAAAAAFEQLLELDPHNAESQAYLAERALERGEVDQAIRRLEEARVRRPDSRILAFALGRAYAAAGRGREARPLLESASKRSIEARPRGAADARLARLQALRRSPLIHERRGHTALDRGEWMVAIAEFRQALALDPERSAVRHNLAAAQLRAGLEQEAKRTLEENLEGPETFVASAVLLASILAEEGRVDRAESILERASSSAPHSALVQTARGQLERARDRPGEAAQHLESAVAADPSQATSWVELVAAYLQAGRGEEAHTALERFSRVFPADPAVEPLTWRRMALEGSRPACRQQAVAEPEYAPRVSALESWTLLLACAGRWQEAIDHQARVVESLAATSSAGRVARQRLERLRTRQEVPPVWLPIERWSRHPLGEPRKGRQGRPS